MKTLKQLRTMWAAVLFCVAMHAAMQSSGQRLPVKPAAPAGTNPPVSLPTTDEGIAAARSQLEARFVGLRSLLGSVPSQDSHMANGATSEEIAERRNLLQQELFSVDSQRRSLRRLGEIRAQNKARDAEAQAWEGFAAPAPYSAVVVEQLWDTVASTRNEAQTVNMLTSIFEGEIESRTRGLSALRQAVRLAQDGVELTPAAGGRERWLVELAELRLRATEAAIEAAETDRLVSSEAYRGLQSYADYLERKLTLARAHEQFTSADLQSLQAQIETQRRSIQQELDAEIITNVVVAQAAEKAQESLSVARGQPGVAAGRVTELEEGVETIQLQVETSEARVDLLRHFLALADYGENLWRDRQWVGGECRLVELRVKRERYELDLERIRKWTQYAQNRFGSVSAQALGYRFKGVAPGATIRDRETAAARRAAYEEQAALYQRCLGVLFLTEGTVQRMIVRLRDKEEHLTAMGRIRYAVDMTGGVVKRVWNTELYIAEDAEIVDGRKIAVSRSVTVGKVVIAMLIFAAGLVVARLSHGMARRVAGGWFKAEEATVRLSAETLAATVGIIGLMVAMAAVRIPWTVFAFVGGALAIGVGFGAQALINNFISGVILFFERSIRVGDIVEVDEQRGKVARIGIRNSLLQRADGVEVLVPNSRFLENNVVNWTLSNTLFRHSISVGVAYGSSTRQVAELMRRAAAEHEHVLKEPPPEVFFEDFGDNALTFTLKFWMRLNAGVDGGTVCSELRHRLNALFEETGVVLAFPQRDVHLDAAGPLEVRVVEPGPAPGKRKLSEGHGRA